MYSVVRCMRAEWRKSRHTPLMLLHILFPLAGAGVFAAYFRMSARNELANVTAFLEAVAIMLPFAIGMIVGMTVQLECGAGHFQWMLGTSSRLAIYVGKLLYLLLLGGGATVFCIVLFAGLYPVMPITFYLKPIVRLLFSMIPLYLISLITGFGLGKSVSVGLGIVGSLLAALMMTGMGDSIWKWIPWAWGIRFVDFCVFEVLYPEQFPRVYGELREGFIIMVICAVVLVTGSLIWMCRWEGTGENQ